MHQRSGGGGAEGYGTAANRRLHRAWGSWLGRSVLATALLHAGVFTLWPQLRVDDAWTRGGEPLNRVYLAAMAEVPLPAPPGEVAIPAVPAVGVPVLELAAEFAAPLPELGERLQVALPTPPLASEDDEWATFQRFAPTMVFPEVRNAEEVRRFLRERYQPLLDADGLSGVVRMHFWIDEAGRVRRAELAGTSGHPALDGLARELGARLQFRPALRRGDPLRVKVVFPIHFEETGAE